MKKKSSKKKISVVKQKTIKHSKLKKQGKLKTVRHKKKSLHRQRNATKHAPATTPDSGEESIQGEEMLEMVDEEDLNFMKDAAVRKSRFVMNHVLLNGGRRERKRKLDEDEDAEDENEDEDDKLEMQYERETDQEEPKRTKYLLPIKTKDGLVRRKVEEDLNDVAEEEEEEEEEEPVVEQPQKTEEEPDSDMELEVELREHRNEINLREPVSTAQLLAFREEALQKRKLLVGVLASGILESPNEKKKNFQKLLDLMNENTPELKITVCKLATLSLLEVFKDLIPGYYIKHQQNAGVKLKKETLQLQGFERLLLGSYKLYLQRLEGLVKVIRKKRNKKFKSVTEQQQIKLGELALNCMCDLLVTHPYFNFSKNLVQMLVPYLNNRMPSVREICATCMKNLFRNDKKGEITLQVVRSINRLVKLRSNVVHTEVLSVLLFLRIKEVNLDREKEEETKQRNIMKHKQRLLSMSRKERKRSKQLEALEKELLETKAEENKQEKHKHLTEITKLVFTIYFRVLKKAPNSRILSITLEGLAKFAHCINLEFYQDIVDVLNHLLEEESLGNREQLHCVQTVFTILSGHGEVLNIDPLRFYKHLYRSLLLVHAGVSHSDVPAVLKTLDQALIQRRKKVSQQRMLAFTKRLAILAMQLLHNGSLGCLATIRIIFQLNRSVDLLLDPDTSVGQGVYFPEFEDPEHCNASNTALWELIALERHYHPTVCKFARNILLGVPATGEGCLPGELSKLKPDRIFTEFDPSEMIFKPVIPAPKNRKSKSRLPEHFQFRNDDLSCYIKKVVDTPVQNKINFSEDLFT